MTTVYLVTDGDYSDYGVLAIFSTRELADKYLDPYRETRDTGSLPRIEEFELDPVSNLVASIQVEMDRQGKPYIGSWEPEVRSPKELGFCYFAGDSLDWRVGTVDKEKAIKVVNEKRTQILAQGLWGDTEKVRQLFGGKTE